MKASLADKLARADERLEELDALLSQPEITGNMESYRKLTREHADLDPVVALYRQYKRVEADRKTAGEMLSDPDMRELAEAELTDSAAKIERLETELQTALLPQDLNDERNIFLEIRAGTGGDESALFAGSLLRMYTRYAERRDWKVEIVSENAGEVGGYKEAIIRIAGEGAYSRLKFESGGHRVQRVPETESQGRIHTSACTVAVMPEVDEVGEVDINPADLRVDTFRASGAGGQHINKTDSAIRITHLPTGLVVECQDDRSQHRNRAQAMSVLAARLKDREVQAQHATEASTRKGLIGSGARSDRIRTYNFPQGRITDHRINLTLHKIDAMMDGDLTELFDALAAEHQAELLATLAGEG